MSWQPQLAVDDDAEVTGGILDFYAWRQNAHVWDVELGELLTWTQPHNLGFGRVQSKPTGSQPGLDIGQTRGETVDGWSSIVDRCVPWSNADQVTILLKFN